MRDLIEFQNEYKKMSEELELKTKELDAKIKELQKFIDDEGAAVEEIIRNVLEERSNRELEKHVLYWMPED